MTERSTNQQIGDLLVGQEILRSRLRVGILEITLFGGMILQVYAPGQKLGIKLLTPNGIIEEGLE